MGTNTAGLYANDVAGTVEMFAIDEGGTATQISPHNFTLFDPDADEPAPWDYHSVNAYLGIEIGVNLTKAIRLVEQLTGETLIHIRALPTRRDWAVDQANNVARAKAEYEAWERKERMSVRTSAISRGQRPAEVDSHSTGAAGAARPYDGASC
jgi:hypothetical protein